MTLTSPPRQTKLQIIHDSGHLFSEMRWEAAAPISPSPALWFSQEASCSLSANHVCPGGALPTHCSLCHLFLWLEIGPPQGSVPLLPRVTPGRGWASTAQGPTALRLSSLDQGRVLKKDTKLFFFFSLRGEMHNPSGLLQPSLFFSLGTFLSAVQKGRAVFPLEGKTESGQPDPLPVQADVLAR